MKKNSTAIGYMKLSIIALIILLIMRFVINNPNKYSWCNEHGWPEGTGNCFSLGLEHFFIDASSVALFAVSIVFAILAIIVFIKKVKK